MWDTGTQPRSTPRRRSTLRAVNEDIVCLECGLRVGLAGPGQCTCAPASIPPQSRTPSSSATYRQAPASAECPRCAGRLRESTVHQALVLDCGDCGGVFVSRSIIEELDKPEGRQLRVAFPVRPRMPEPDVVRYLICPMCQTRMNRQNFARESKVIVDICKEDGIWFDAGEVHAVIDFVEAGGLERAQRRAAQDRASENDRLRKEWRVAHEASTRETTLGRRHPQISAAERELAETFLSWLRR